MVGNPRSIGGTVYCKRCGSQTYPVEICQCDEVPKEILITEDEIEELKSRVNICTGEIKELKEQIKIKQRILKKISKDGENGRNKGSLMGSS